MDRYLGIDYGDARLGIAITDPLKITAYPLTLLSNNEELFDNLKDILNDYNFSKIVIGYPKNLDGSESRSTQKVREFCEKLSTITEIGIEFVDERLTTVEASKKLHEMGLDSRQQKDKIDMTSAVLILQSYLDRS